MEKNTEKSFKKGDKVTFLMKGRGKSKGKGQITRLPPKNATRGEARLTIKDDEGRLWRPYPSQCQRA